MLVSLFLDIFIIALILGGVQFYVEAHVGIDNLTQKIEADWLRTTIRILLKVGAAVLIIAGVVCTIICAIAISYKPKDDNKK